MALAGHRSFSVMVPLSTFAAALQLHLNCNPSALGQRIKHWRHGHAYSARYLVEPGILTILQLHEVLPRFESKTVNTFWCVSGFKIKTHCAQVTTPKIRIPHFTLIYRLTVSHQSHAHHSSGTYEQGNNTKANYKSCTHQNGVWHER